MPHQGCDIPSRASLQRESLSRRYLTRFGDATYQIWAVVITYLGAWLSDRWGRRPFAIMFAALTLVAVWSITLVPSGVPLYLAGALLFGFNG